MPDIMDLHPYKVSPEPNSGCWLWVAYCCPQGYGVVWDAPRIKRAHRVSWEMSYGPIPEGLKILHKCDNPPCVNPEHLFIGTLSDNVQDMLRKGRDGRAKTAQTLTGRVMPYIKGSKNGRPNRRLTDDQITAIRADTRSCRVVAAEYGVSPQHVSKVRRKERWAWL